MNSEVLSTVEAARFCSVKPNTVYKWIRQGRLKATRTARGPYRIEKHDLVPFIPALAVSSAVDVESVGSQSDHLPCLRCWEYFSQPGEVREQCRNCPVYQVQAAWCFQVASSLGCESGQKATNCATSCNDCPYYRRATGQSTNVLVVTGDQEFADALSSGVDGLTIRFTRNGYEASAMISVFRAAFVVVDQEVIESGNIGLIESIGTDVRLPGVRIILAVPKGESARLWDPIGKAVICAIEKPFGQGSLAEIVGRFPVELVPLQAQVQKA